MGTESIEDAEKVLNAPVTQKNMSRRHRHRNLLTPWLLLPGGLILLPFLLPNATDATADLVLVMPLLHVIGITLIWNRWGRPKGWWRISLTITANFAAAAVPVLCWFGLYHYALLLAAGVSLRMIIAVSAVFCGGVILLLCETIRRGKLRWRPWVPGLLRIGFAVLLTVPVLEFTALLIERSKFQPLPMPGTLPAAAAGEIRIAAVGGSTMLGFPYEPHYSIGHVLAWQLRQMYPEHEVLLENLAVTGANLEQALAKLGDLTQKPDVILVYSGHNQFFHRLEELSLARSTSWGAIDDWMSLSAVFRIVNPLLAQQMLVTESPAGDRRLCGNSICPEHLLKTRLTRYARQLEDFFRWANQNGIAVVFCSPVAGESDFEPNLSLGDPGDLPTMAAIEKQWSQVRSLQQNQEWAAALDLCSRLIQEYPDVAEFRFRAGKCCVKLSEVEAARSHFENAINMDQFPIRALDSYREAGLQTAMQNGVTRIDTEDVIRRHAEHGLLSTESFLDGVHPNLRSTYLIGRAVTDAAMAADVFHRHGTPSSPHRLSFPESMQAHNIDADVLAKAYETTVDVLNRYSDFRPFDRERRLHEADEYKTLAAKLRDQDIVPGQDGTESLDVEVQYRGSDR
ncbi:MAG: hypothetical protein ABGZ53_17750 [Fuerstiella sp.]